MNINLIYEGKDYNFDIPNGVTIDYLKELSSRIFNSDKALLDLIYNNKKIENKDDNILIRDLIPEGETNTILTVQINKDQNNSTKDTIVPLVSLKAKIIDNNDNNKDSNDNQNNKEQKENKERTNTSKKDSKKKLNMKTLDKEKDILHMIKEKNNSRNKLKVDTNQRINIIRKEFDLKTFQTYFYRKNKELFELIREFNNKIKEIYLSLYKKYKNAAANNNITSLSNNSSISSISIGLNNNYYYELSIYEKKLIVFQESQINYYRILLELIKKYEQNGDILQLNDFYKGLIINNNFIKSNGKENNDELMKYIKYKKSMNSKLTSNNSLKNNNLSSLNINSTNHLPVLKNKNINISMSHEKKNFSLSGIHSYQTKNQISNIKAKIMDEIKEKPQIINFINKSIKTTKMKKEPLLLESKTNINKNIKINNNQNENNNEKNNNNENNNNNNINENNSKSNVSSIVSDELSEKDLVEDINVNKNKIAPIPLHIRNSLSTNILPRKFSMINNAIVKNRTNSIINNHNGLESVDRGKEEKEKENEKEKEKQKLPLFNSVNFQNRINSPIKKKITINDNSPFRSKRKGINDSTNENVLANTRKIKDIDVSSMTINDSNFIRDKQKVSKMKNHKDMNKFDFFM